MNKVRDILNSNGVVRGEKFLFIIDLLICSVWGLFMFSTWGFSLRALMVPMLLVMLRIGISFLVYKRVGYGLYSAIGFAVILLCYEQRDFVIALPIIKMVDYACMIIGGAAPKLFYADYYYTADKEMGTLIAYVGYAWLAGYPILFGLYALLKVRNVKLWPFSGWKAIIKYVIAVSLFAYCYEFVREPALPPYWWMWTLLMSLVPIIIECHRQKECEAGFVPIWKDRQVEQYGLLSLIVFGAFLIGCENPGYLGLVGVAALPVLLMCVILLFNGGRLQRKDAIVLVFGSSAFWWAQFFDHESKMLLMVANLCCIAYACFMKEISWKTMLFVPVCIAVFIQPFCIGYNLYAATDVGLRSKYRYYDPAIHGLWLVDCGNDKKGLRDRYGMILDADYEESCRCNAPSPS